MQGLELAERYYRQAVAPLIAQRFPVLGLTPGLTAAGCERRNCGQTLYNPGPLIAALRETLPAPLRDLEIEGALDQWVTHEDVLIWAKHFSKFGGIYRHRSHERRDSVGDMMI